MTRRRMACCLGVGSAAILSADERSDVLEAITPLATALSAGEVEAFLEHLSNEAPERDQLKRNLQGLLAQAEVTCSVRLLRIEGGRAEVDWYMELRSRTRSTVLERRKSSVFVQVRNRSIVAIEPISFFRPPEAG